MDIRNYIGHKASCSFNPSISSDPDGDWCICGFTEAREAFDSLRKAREHRGELGCDSCAELCEAIDNVTKGGTDGPRVRRL